MSQPLLQVENLNIAFETNRGDIRPVRDVTFAIHPGQTVATVGSLEVRPGAASVIPGHVRLLLDARGVDGASLDVVEARVRDALKRMVVGSIGPTTSETLRELDIEPDFEPSHPKMGFLVNETAARATQIIGTKR